MNDGTPVRVNTKVMRVDPDVRMRMPLKWKRAQAKAEVLVCGAQPVEDGF